MAGGRVKLIRESKNVRDTNTGVEVWGNGGEGNDEQLEVLAEIRPLLPLSES